MGVDTFLGTTLFNAFLILLALLAIGAWF